MCDFSVKTRKQISYCIEISEETKRELDGIRAEHNAECAEYEKYGSYNDIIQFTIYSSK